ncbi:MAG TPA: sulfotransferase [Patescibacteria group bacterium]|nr:sulfotransferase [Patescibacteria group bacterium]
MDKHDPAQRYAAAVDALNRGAWAQAQSLVQPLMQAAPGHGGVWFIAGVAALNLRQLPQAAEHLDRATRLSPARADYGAYLARALMELSLMGPALHAADAAALRPNKDAVTLELLGVVYSRANAHAKAAAAFGQVAELRPTSATAHFNLATALTALGDIPAAATAHARCLALDPRYWKAHLALAQLQKQQPAQNHLPQLTLLLAEHGRDPTAAMYLHLALAKEMEDLGDDSGAFAHLVAGKAAGRRDYDFSRDLALFDAVIDATSRWPEGSPGHDSRRPIFIVGMPRSGTTLVERILSSHPDVASCGELQDFGVALKRASGSSTRLLIDPDTARRAVHVDGQRLGAAYLDSTRAVSGTHPRFIDKLPHNFLYAGYIARALPNARIVCLRRDPMDTCLGNFRQLFAQTSPFYDYSFDLLDTGRYYLQFDRLMRHWQSLFPGRIHEVRYEDLVSDQEATTRALLAACGLDWDPACLSFERNEAPVATASAVQVREPIHARSVQRWKRFESELAPLRALLRAGGLAID